MKLSPIESLYASLLEARARRYAKGSPRVTRLSCPVVSVGNLTLGGTGKTPLVEAIARRLRFEGWKPAILSRGYRRTSRGVVVVSKGTGPLVGPDEGGDEPVALARQLPGVLVVVGSRRAEAGRAAEELGADLLLLDDGYQHLALARDVNLLLLDARDPVGGERFPPFGRLREPLSALARADAFVFTRTAAGFPTLESLRLAGEARPEAPIFTARIRPAGLLDESGSPLSEASLAGRRFVAVCGIARPETFEASLAQLGLAPEETLVFPDHHRYGPRDVARIRRTAEESGASLVLTTEKDTVKLGGRLPLPAVSVHLSAEVVEPGFFSFLASRLPRPSSPMSLSR